MKKTGIVYSSKFLDHDTGYSHPENKNRLSSIISLLSSKSYYNELIKLEPQEASKEDIIQIHEEDYFESLKQSQKQTKYRCNFLI